MSTWQLCALLALVVCVSALLNAAPKSERKVFADVSTHVMIAGSVWGDFDLEYTLEDLQRFRGDYPAEKGPRGLFLKEGSNGALYYAKPPLYGVTASIFYGLFGINGFLVLNSLCLFLVALVVARSLAASFGEAWATVAAAGFVLFSPFVTWVPVAHPDLFVATLLAVSCFLAVREGRGLGSTLAGAVLFGAVLGEKPTFLLLLPFIMLAMGWRAWRAPLMFCGVSLLTFMALSSINLLVDGNLLAYQGNRFYVGRHTPFPLESGWQLPYRGQLSHLFDTGQVILALLSNITLLGDKLVDFLVGRQTGILPYFPMAFLLLVLAPSAGWNRSLWLLAGLFAYLGLNLFAFPTNGYGGSGTYGSRYLMQALPLVALAYLSAGKPVAPTRQRIHRGLVMLGLVLGVGLQWRLLPPDAQIIPKRHDYLKMAPMSWFPVERWLLPRSRLATTEVAANSRDFVFLPDQAGAHHRRVSGGVESRESVILFQSGEDRLFPPLQLLAATDREAALVDGERVLWRGRLAAGQPETIRLDSQVFTASAFDLLDNNYKRLASLELVSVSSDMELRRPMPPLRLGFARPHGRFAAYNEDLAASELAAAGVQLRSGWSAVRPWGVWSEASIADVLVPVGQDAAGYELEMNLLAYTPAGSDALKFQAACNGRDGGIMEARDEVELRIACPVSSGAEFVHLVLYMENPRSPRELGIGKDTRQLGLGLRRLRVNRNEG